MKTGNVWLAEVSEASEVVERGVIRVIFALGHPVDIDRVRLEPPVYKDLWTGVQSWEEEPLAWASSALSLTA